MPDWSVIEWLIGVVVCRVQTSCSERRRSTRRSARTSTSRSPSWPASRPRPYAPALVNQISSTSISQSIDQSQPDCLSSSLLFSRLIRLWLALPTNYFDICLFNSRTADGESHQLLQYAFAITIRLILIDTAENC